MLNKISSKESGITTKVCSNNDKAGMVKFQSSMNITSKNDFGKNLLTESTSSKFFPKLPEFYNENENYFWQKEMKKMKSEKSIFADKIGLKKDSSKIKTKFFYD